MVIVVIRITSGHPCTFLTSYIKTLLREERHHFSNRSLPLYSSCSANLTKSIMNPLCVLLALFMVCQGAFGWTQGDRDQILQMHNNYRREHVQQKGACHMNKIEYDQEMENAAMAYAKQCVYKHKFDKYGENFAYNTNKESDSALIGNAIKSWYGEIVRYRYGQEECGPSNTCHYTQIVAASAKKMGCYAHRCPNLAGAAPNAWFFVCYYTPKGNWKGENAYPKNCDTPCKEGQTEENGLCVGEAEDESESDSAPVECKDTSEHCQVWKETAQCEMNPKYMNKACPVACEKCKP